MEWLERVILGNPARYWIAAGAILLVGSFGLALVRSFAVKRLKKYASDSTASWDNLLLLSLNKTHRWFFFVASLFVALGQVDLSPKTSLVIHRILLVAFLFQVMRWGLVWIQFWVSQWTHVEPGEDGSRATTFRAVGFLLKTILFTIVLLWGLDGLGVNITTLVAGLGVGGIALALAVQNILADIFASLTIVVDKPFVIGDTIQVGDITGSVERIGLKTTRIKNLEGDEVIYSNTDLLKNRIRNHRRMKRRRVVLQIGVVYQTPLEKLKQIPALLRAILEAQPQVTPDRINLFRLGESSIDFECIYYVETGEMNVHATLLGQILFQILAKFEEADLEFAYPTRTLFLTDTHEGTLEQAVSSFRNPDPGAPH